MTKPEPDDAAEKRRLEILGQIKAFDLPPLEEGTPAYVSLEASLLQHGCINPIVMHGDEVISLRACKAICDKHGIKYEIVQLDDWNEADLISIKNDLNFVGRHIDTAIKKEFAKHLLLGSHGKLSNRAVGSMACLSPKTVQVVREELEASEEIPHTIERYSRDGRSQNISDKEERKGDPTEPDKPEDADQPEDGDDDEPDDESEDGAGSEGEEDPDEMEEDDLFRHLVAVDDELPEHRPDYVYEVNKLKGSIVRRKIKSQRGNKYYLSNGGSLPKYYGHLTWLESHESLKLELQSDKESTEDDIEDFGEQKKELAATLKDLEAQIVTATKEKEKLDQRLKKVEQMVPPKSAAAEIEEEAA